MTPACWIATYVAGALFTALVNLSLGGRPQYGWAIARNVLLWPVMLPVITALWAYFTRHERRTFFGW